MPALPMQTRLDPDRRAPVGAHAASEIAVQSAGAVRSPGAPRRHVPLRWALVVAAGLGVELAPVPAGITGASWHVFALFVGTVVGILAQPLPAAAMVFFGISALAATRAIPLEQVLAGYADPIAWLVLCAFFLSRGMLKSGLGRRIALGFVRRLGRSSLGLAYALAATDLILASFIPSNAARCGILFPIARSISESYDSRPGPTARRIGAFLMNFLCQCDAIIGALWLTGQASNPLMARFARELTGIDLGYAQWALGASVPVLVSLGVTSLLLYWLEPPELRRTADAARGAGAELEQMGPMSGRERGMLAVFALVAGLWMTQVLHGIPYAAVALVGICASLLLGVLDWDDVTTESGAWSVFVWYGGLIGMATALGATGVVQRFAELTGGWTQGVVWGLALAALLLVYFYAHYAFATIGAHATAMFTPFLVVILAAGTPPWLAVLLLVYVSNLMASLTHYGSAPAVVYFGAGYMPQSTWWRLGFLGSVSNLLVWTTVGPLWWRVLGLW